jgi:lipid II:glycine glycyltransferase (peptidoglycan interpeptide bridge formation enzyme)
MQFKWTTKLSEEQYSTLKEFYSKISFVHIEQLPRWPEISQLGIPISYCIAINDDIVEGYAIIYEHKRIYAEIKFGPLATSSEICIKIIQEVIRYYSSKRFLSLQVILGMEAGTNATFIQYSLYQKNRFKWYLDKRNKSTLLLRLDNKTEDQLLRHFSENHRRSIKKAQKNNLICKKIFTATELLQFTEGYNKMLEQRKIKGYLKKNIKSFTAIFEWLKNEDNGFFLGIFEGEEMVGGMLILYRAGIAEYYAGFTLPDERKIPIAHFAFYEIMKMIKRAGKQYFDFGGYNLMVKEKDQVYQINKFKKGFHADYFFYSPGMYFNLIPMGNQITRFLKKIKDLYAKQ